MCAPTPVGYQNTPDISILKYISEEISKHLKEGHIIVYESTVGIDDIRKLSYILYKECRQTFRQG